MSTKDDLVAAYRHLRSGDVRAALLELDLPARTAEARARAEQVVRRAWMKYALRKVRQNDAHDRLDLAYTMPDPWHMASAQEQARFVETNALIERALGDHFGTLLEIGCGEGHQTQYLAALAGEVTGLDVSANAIARARARLPDVEFAVGDVYAQPWADAVGKFDLVTACEVIYYMSDMPKFLRTIDRLGRACLVTYFAPAARKVEAHVQAMPGVETGGFRFHDVEWIAAWWPGASQRG
ncbi:MAG: class I SAM-dependent methyltransferase [Kofleriaceae bacterium]